MGTSPWGCFWEASGAASAGFSRTGLLGEVGVFGIEPGLAAAGALSVHACEGVEPSQGNVLGGVDSEGGPHVAQDEALESGDDLQAYLEAFQTRLGVQGQTLM